MSANIAIIAATPGFSIVEPVTEDDKIVEAVLVPIVGWIISEGIVHPVSMFEFCKNNDYPIMTPAGIVFDAFQTPYDSIQDWMTYKNKEV